MKKLISLVMSLVMMMSTCFILSSCGDDKEPEVTTTYIAAAGFYYSNDKGHTYGNGTKEYSVGETVYMKVKAKVTSNKDDPETVKATLTIPNVTALDAKYYDGQPITPKYDAVLNVTTYEFTIAAAKNALEWEYVFQFVPNAESEVKLLLEFDDKIDAMYDKQNTVKFIASENSNGETAND